MCVLADVNFRKVTNTEVQAAAKVHTLQRMCSELLADRSRSFKIRSEEADVNFQEGKSNRI
jgi:hypothetical protein